MIVLREGRDFLLSQPQVGDPEFVRGTGRISRGVGAPTPALPTHVRLFPSLLCPFPLNHRARQNANETPLFFPSLQSFSFLLFSTPLFPARNGNQLAFAIISLNDLRSDDTGPTPSQHRY